jgi:enoyl-CoA hydratase
VRPTVALRVRGAVAWLTLARPADGNRLDAELLGELAAAATAAEEDEAVRVVVLGAAGRAFSLGLPEGCRWPEPAWPDGVGRVAALGKPVIAAVAGEARGLGAALVLACDLRLMTPSARLVVPPPDTGFPGGGLVARLARYVGAARAAELVLLGGGLSARRALAWGLATAVVPPGRLRAAVARLAQKLAARAPLALRCAKEAVGRALDLSLDDGIRLEHDLYVLLQTTADRQEGVRAFLAGRRPRFEAR